MIEIHETEIGKAVMATKLYDYLGLSKPQYSRFIKKEVLGNPYADELSYLEIPKTEGLHGRYRTEYALGIRFAIMICRTSKSLKSTKMQSFLSSHLGQEVCLIRPKRKELIFGDMLDSIFHGFLSFRPQYILERYRIDFFCPELGLCIEYDEFHHNSLPVRANDIERQKTIEEKFGYRFLRVLEGAELEGINSLLKIMTSKK